MDLGKEGGEVFGPVEVPEGGDEGVRAELREGGGIGGGGRTEDHEAP